MELRDWITIAAISLSPLIAVGITLWYQRRAEKKDIEEGIFFTLMENRGEVIISPETVQALNSIFVVFHGNKEIINLWSNYFDSLSPAGHEPTKSYRLYIELLSAIAKHLDYKELTQMQIDKVYTPQMHIDIVEHSNKIGKEFSRVLENTNNFGNNPKGNNRTSTRKKTVKKTV